MPNLRIKLADPERLSPAAVARKRRFAILHARFPQLSEMRVLDLGGEAHTWLDEPAHPRTVTLLNRDMKLDSALEQIERQGASSWMTAVGGNACDPPEQIKTEHFDLVYSNSVFEHVGGHQPRRHFSYWAQTLAKHHWVQTPNRYFPFEPHWLAPGFQFASPRLQAVLLRHWPLASPYYRKPAWPESVQRAMSIELLSPASMRSYFPTSELVRERLLGMTKSLIAVR